MHRDATRLIGKEVYTPRGRLLGEVNNLILDLDLNKVDGIFLDWTDPGLVEDSMAVNVPYRWVQAVGDVVLLRHFPEWVSAGDEDTHATL